MFLLLPLLFAESLNPASGLVRFLFNRPIVFRLLSDPALFPVRALNPAD